MASGSESINLGSDEVKQTNCDVCLTQGDTSEAVSYCTICNEHLCQRCEQSHRGSKASKDHTILTGSAVPIGSTRTCATIQIEFCDTHKSKLISIYCSTHDEVICNLCKMTSHRQCGTIDVFLKVANSNIANSVKVVAKELVDLKDLFNDVRNQRQADQLTMKVQIEMCLNDMYQIRASIEEMLDNIEKTMTAELTEIEDKLSKEIDEHEEMLEESVLKIDDLKKSLDECQNTRRDEILFIGMKKASSRKVEFEKIIESIQEDIHPIEIRLVTDDVLANVKTALESLVTVSTGQHTLQRASVPTSMLNLSVIDKQEIALDSCHARSCIFMPDGHLVVGFEQDGLKLFDQDFKLKSQMPIFSKDIGAISSTDVIVTQGADQQLKRVQVLPDIMAVKRTLKIDKKCYGVDVSDGKIFTTCHDGPGNGEVRVLSLDGKEQARLGYDNGTYMFTSPGRVKVNTDGGKLFVSDWSTHIVTCLDKQGHVMFNYSDRELVVPKGMFVDRDGNLLVCGQTSFNVHLVRHDGQKEKLILSQKDGMKGPVDIAYRHTDGCLSILMDLNGTNEKLVTCTTKL